MKNIIFACCFIFALTSLNAQDSLHLKVGFFFAPQAGISFQSLEEGTYTITPVSACASFSKGRSVLNAMYNLTYNKVQLVYWHKLGKYTGAYTALNKSVFTKGGYASVGVSRDVYGGNAFGFFEIGSTWNKWSPVIYIGAIIPLTLSIQ